MESSNPLRRSNNVPGEFDGSDVLVFHSSARGKPEPAFLDLSKSTPKQIMEFIGKHSPNRKAEGEYRYFPSDETMKKMGIPEVSGVSGSSFPEKKFEDVLSMLRKGGHIKAGDEKYLSRTCHPKAAGCRL